MMSLLISFSEQSEDRKDFTGNFHSEMSLLGLTGGIGMGKSVVASMFSENGFELIDTDEIAHKLTMFGGAALPEIRSSFGSECLNEDGSLNRLKMARRIFSDKKERLKLEAILHPKIRKCWQEKAQPFRGSAHKDALIVIPLLFETRLMDEFLAIICVACKKETQMERLKMRNWSEKDAQARINAQLPIAEKIKRSQFLIWTDCSIELTRKQVRHSIKKIRNLDHKLG